MEASYSARSILNSLRNELANAGIGNYLRESEWLIEDVTGLRREDILLDRDKALTVAEVKEINEKLERRAGGEPLQYILGNVEFCGLKLRVGPGVLIPRPETEQLVEIAGELYSGEGMVCDLCTGSGAVAIGLASLLQAYDLYPDIIGVDISGSALRYAVDNIKTHQLSNIRLVQGDLFNPFPVLPIFSMVCVNPPYVTTEDFRELPSEISDYEPALALAGGDRGLDIIQKIMLDVSSLLDRENGVLICEIGAEQAEACCRLAHDAGFARVEVRKDYSGRSRFIVAGVTAKPGDSG